LSWGNLENFLAMGGYGLYVWGSYGVTFALIFAELVLLARRRRQRGWTHSMKPRHKRIAMIAGGLAALGAAAAFVLAAFQENLVFLLTPRRSRRKRCRRDVRSASAAWSCPAA